MHNLAKVTLENEMDLVLAHRRSMKLAELAGLSLSAQTTFATAVSEVSRNTIENGKNGCLTLGISDDKKRSIIACIKDDNLHGEKSREGLVYAKRLVDKLNVFSEEDEKSIELYYYVPVNEIIDTKKIDEWRSLFRNEPPLSPYDEIKRKNEQLLEMAEKVRQSESHYQQLTDTLPLLMFSLDESGMLTYVNNWMVEYFGYSFEQLKNMDRRELVHPDDRPADHTLSIMIEEQKPVTAEWRIKDKAGNFKWHMVSVLPWRKDNKTDQWFGFLVDIHAQKMLEQALKENLELKVVQDNLAEDIVELNRSNEELQQFAYVASHDLQEPLRKIMFYSDYIQKTYSNLFDGRTTGYLESMINASQRMRLLISDLLSFSQVDKRSLNFQPVDINVIINRAIATYEMSIKDKSALVHTDTFPTIEGDEMMLQRLFENLLSNSLKYSREKVPPQIIIAAQVNEGQVSISFADNGIGFQEEFHRKVFGLFQRLHTKDKFSGTGLGLAICLKVVEMHCGSIDVDSKVDVGTTFRIKLPAKQQSVVTT